MLDAIAPNGEQSLFRRSAPYESPARCGNVSNAAMLRQEKPAETCGLFLCPCPRYSQPNAGRDCAQWRTIAVPSLRSLRIPRQVRECEQCRNATPRKTRRNLRVFCCFEKNKAQARQTAIAARFAAGKAALRGGQPRQSAAKMRSRMQSLPDISPMPTKASFLRQSLP